MRVLLFILRINHLLEMGSANILLWSLSSLLILLQVPFAEQKILILIKSNSSFFSCMDHVSGDMFKSLCMTLSREDILRGGLFKVLYLRSLTHFEWIFVEHLGQNSFVSIWEPNCFNTIC